jgi:hypothetical protein
MKKSSIVALVALTASVMADDMGKSAGGQQMNRPDSGMMNVSAYPMIDSNKWDLWAAATLWHADQGGSEWAVKYEQEHATEVEGDVRAVDFGWNWGFKVGGGYNMMKHDEWDTQLYYTWFRASKEEEAGVPTSVLVPNESGTLTDVAVDSLYTFPQSIGTYDANNIFKNGEIDWHINFNMFDWELGRGYMVSKHLMLRPHVGIKGGWIHQNIHGHFNSFVDARRTYHFKNNFWGVGPSGGVNTKWELGNWSSHYFSFCGDFMAAYMYGRVNNHFEQNDPSFNEIELKAEDRHLGQTMLQAFLGFGWDTNFNDDQCHFCLRLGYEYQHWFNQLQSFTNFEYHRENFDLTLQGGTLDVRLDF